MATGLFTVLRNRNARFYLAGVTVSGFGDSAMLLAAGVWVKELTGSNGLDQSLGLPVERAAPHGIDPEDLAHAFLLTLGELPAGDAVRPVEVDDRPPQDAVAVIRAWVDAESAAELLRAHRLVHVAVEPEERLEPLDQRPH